MYNVTIIWQFIKQNKISWHALYGYEFEVITAQLALEPFMLSGKKST